jgi:hypothetical protein
LNLPLYDSDYVQLQRIRLAFFSALISEPFERNRRGEAEICSAGECFNLQTKGNISEDNQSIEVS